MNTDLFEIFKERRSIRRFRPGSIKKEDLMKIFEAARLAPSGNNLQPWQFIIVRDEFRKRLLSKAAHNQDFIKEAEVLVVALGVPQPRFVRKNRIPHLQDPMIAIEHMVLAATALGYGTCWIGAFDEEEVKRILKVPKRLNVIAMLPIGEPAEFPGPQQRKKIQEIFFEEEYGKPIQS